ncbi:CBS domain-containing protein [Streptomyces lavendofoliae]|uniref:CBS domain-containing protein n=1 Tax=Streptomyces lavendofoliae TaxID=67314 RepID=A0A918M566_9ACTN|nr:hypothetical protein GCM10010274_29930 [Streptomyces lavendofoliae]
MTQVQTRPAVTRATVVTHGTGLTARDAMEAPGPQVDDHMTVDVAMSVLISARVEHLLIQDETGRCSGLVTRAQLAAHRGGSWYVDRTRLRDIPLDRGPFTCSAAVLGDAEAAMRGRTLDVSPVVDEHGYPLGILSLFP